MYKSQNEKLAVIVPGVVVVGVDIAKREHCGQAIYHNGIVIGKPFSIKNTIDGFKSLLAKFERLKQETGCRRIMVGLEPTGHYWKALAWFLIQNKIEVVLVNPHHVKKSKELDDNTQTKSDPKDAKIIAKLVKDGRFSEVYLPQGVYGELRNLVNFRNQLKAKLNSVKNIVIAILDEYFPEYATVFKNFDGKASLHILYHYPFPEDLKKLGTEKILVEFRKVVKRGLGQKRAESLYQAAINSIGIPANNSAKMKIRLYLDEFQLLIQQMKTVEQSMAEQLTMTGIGNYILSIKGLGIVTVAGLLGELGDPARFINWKQLRKLAGFNLIENSSGDRKGRHVISKRGRKGLRAILYQAALMLVSQNNEFKQLYQYLLKRRVNPLKKKQALVMIATKLLRVIFTLCSKKEMYDSSKVLGLFREDQLKAA